MTFGKGRVVVLGEAGMFSAQIATLVDGNRKLELKFGMNVPGHDDQQFALNVMHWFPVFSNSAAPLKLEWRVFV